MNKKSLCRYFYILHFLILLVFSTNFLYSQNCNNVAGSTSFEPLSGYEKEDYYDFNGMAQAGPSGNIFSTGATLATKSTDFSKGQFVYAITQNPSIVDATLPDVDDPMFIVRTNCTQLTPLFTYTVSGLKEGSEVTVNLDLSLLTTLASACGTKNQYSPVAILYGINPSDANGNNLKSLTFDFKKT